MLASVLSRRVAEKNEAIQHACKPNGPKQVDRTKMLLSQDPEVTLFENFVSQEEAPSMLGLQHP